MWSRKLSQPRYTACFDLPIDHRQFSGLHDVIHQHGLDLELDVVEAIVLPVVLPVVLSCRRPPFGLQQGSPVASGARRSAARLHGGLHGMLCGDVCRRAAVRELRCATRRRTGT